ncbi:endolytic transglycosylase MltG [Psychrobacillus sp. OK032]|uniref:endolytic transglycosylase MltG n=1 Tax=Psychrobacillus sp. OK032 TaxID=1884358 RepID=UPI0008C0DE60|nr:endolytic transglycosylase MltG [Psychrobacillus sp. OK032]SER81302.1 YceG-like family protein [Psychrobacillus sp. OK032]
MNKTTIRFLGIGLFFAGAAFQIQLMLGDDAPAKDEITQEAYEQAQKELISVKDQLAQLQLDLDNTQTGPTAIDKVEEPSESSSSGARNTVLHIQTGMTSRDISVFLEQAGIIQNKQDFADYLSAQDLSGKIQIGQYELNSTMSLKQIAEIITK